MNEITKIQPSALMSISDLGVLNYAAGFTTWIYKSGTHTFGDILAPAYFGGASDMISEGDFINVSGKGGGAILFVNEVAPGMVGTAPMVFAARGLA